MENQLYITPQQSFKFLSEKAVDIHFNQHHKKYVSNLVQYCEKNQIKLPDKENLLNFASKHKDNLFLYNNAAQISHHNLFWDTIENPVVDHDVVNFLEESCDFSNKFRSMALGSFGSCWVWLVKKQNQLTIEVTGNADFPEGTLLLCLDMWEHAFYVDYQATKVNFIESFLENINFRRLAPYLES